MKVLVKLECFHSLLNQIIKLILCRKLVEFSCGFESIPLCHRVTSKQFFGFMLDTKDGSQYYIQDTTKGYSLLVDQIGHTKVYSLLVDQNLRGGQMLRDQPVWNWWEQWMEMPANLCTETP